MLTRRESFQLELDLLNQWEFEYGEKATPSERMARQLRREEIRKALAEMDENNNEE